MVFAEAIGEHPGLGEAVVRAVVDAEGEAPVRVDDFQSLEDPPAWSVIPPHERHVLACLGPRCTSRGAGRLYVHFWKHLQERGLLRGRSGVHAVQTGCLSPCNLGPTMVVYPEGVWYCGPTTGAIDRIIDEHFVGGRVIEEYAQEPGRHERPVPEGGRQSVSETERGSPDEEDYLLPRKKVRKACNNAPPTPVAATFSRSGRIAADVGSPIRRKT